MTDTTASEDAGISRRRALQAGVAGGVGLVAWSGASITSLGGTPAYAAGCTNFTLNFSVTDMSTNQSEGCNTFTYNNSPPLSVKVDNYEFNVPNGGNFACADTPACFTFTHPADETCTITIRVHRNHFADSTVIFGATTVSTSGSTPQNFCLPAGSGTPPHGTQTPNGQFTAAFLGDNVSPTFWSVFVQCVKTNQAGCLTSTTASPN